MPHILIDYSANLDDRIDMAGLCHALREAAIETGVFPKAGIRVRAIRCDHVSIADGDPGHGYLDIAVRIGTGRSEETRRRAAEHVFGRCRAFCAADLEARSLMLSLELREIDPLTAQRASSIRNYLPKEDH